MGLLRRLFGSPGSQDRDPDASPDAQPGPEPGGRLETDGGGDPRIGDDPARARELTGAFDAGLDDLGRRQLRFADRAWEPPSQIRRDGAWVLMERWEARRDDGRAVTLKSGERITYVGSGSAWPGSTRFETAKGDLVDLPPGQAEDGWPDDLQRPRSPTAGSEDG